MSGVQTTTAALIAGDGAGAGVYGNDVISMASDVGSATKIAGGGGADRSPSLATPTRLPSLVVLVVTPFKSMPSPTLPVFSSAVVQEAFHLHLR